MAHRLVRAGIGLDLRAVRRHPAHFQRTRFQRDLQNLLEESLQRLQMDLAEIGYGADVPLIIAASTRKAIYPPTSRRSGW